MNSIADDAVNLTIKEAEDLVSSILIAYCIDQSAAILVAKALVAAEIYQKQGHGLLRLASYIDQIKSGKINKNAKISLHQINTNCVLVDADCGFAYQALDIAIQAGSNLAKKNGICAMAVQNSHHCGALALQVEKIADYDLIALMFANTPKAIAPWGSSQAFFGTNPIAFAAPRLNQPPLVIDLSLSKVARGQILRASLNKQNIDESWALDQYGKPTIDPNQALQGSMSPIGDAKGVALCLIVEILAGVLTGSHLSSEASSFLNTKGNSPKVGQFMIALNPLQFNYHFFARLEFLLTAIESIDGARLPGDKRVEQKKYAEKYGIPIAKKYLEQLNHLAKN